MNGCKESELTALVEWIETFPQLKIFQDEKENRNSNDLISDPKIASSVFDVALEIYDCDGDETIMTHASEVWDNILSLTRKTCKRKILHGTPSKDWEEETKYGALASLLDGAVSHPDFELRKEYIGRITQLPRETQRCLMGMIERQKREVEGNRQEKRMKTAHAVHEKTNTPARRISKPCILSARKPNRSPFTPRSCHSRPILTNGNSRRSLFTTPKRAYSSECSQALEVEAETPSFLSPGLGDTTEYEKEVQELRDQNDKFLSTLKKYRLNEEDMKSKYEEMESKYRNEMMKVEAASRRQHEETKRELQGKITKLESDLSELIRQVEASEEAKAQLDAMKDEMELMKHTKSMLDDTTERLNNYKEKLTQLTDIKDALEKEEEAHSRSIDENIRLKNEIGCLNSMKRNLDVYKTRATEAEVRFAEVNDELTKVKQKLHDTTTDHENLQMTLQSHKEEIGDLHRQIKHEKGAEIYGTRLGEGFSELNPEIKEELLSLRNENAQLRQFAKKREDDSVSRLELQVEDTHRLAERYKSQFLSFKGKFENTQSDLENSISREQKLQFDYTVKVKESTSMKLQLQETKQELATIHQNLDASRDRESMLEEELSSWVKQARALQERTDEMTNRLHRCNQNLENAQRREVVLNDKIANLERKDDESNNHIASLAHKFGLQAKELRDAYENCEDLSQDNLEWVEKAKSASDLANDISDKLASCVNELQEARRNNILIQEKLNNVSELAQSTQMELEETRQKLHETDDDLQDLICTLESAKQREQTLLSDLQGVNQRAQDTTHVLTEKITAIATLEEEIEEARADKQLFQAKEELLTSEIEALQASLQDKDVQIASITREASIQNEEKTKVLRDLERSQEETNKLTSLISGFEHAIEESQEKEESYAQQLKVLESELVETRENLVVTNQSLRTLSEAEMGSKEQLNSANATIRSLEEKLDKERSLKSKVEADFTLVCNANRKMENDLKIELEDLQIKYQDQLQVGNRYKGEIDRLNEVLNETQSTMSAAQHRENMLHHKIQLLEDQESDLKAAIETARESANNDILEASKSFEVTREVLNSKTKKYVEEMQNKMNLLLEEEANRKRQLEKEYKEKLKQLQEKMDKVATDITEKAEKAQMEARLRCERLQKEHDQLISKMKEDANEECTQLVRKGKGMLKELKAKQLEERGKLEREIKVLDDKCLGLSNEKELAIKEFKAKAREYRKKLQFASGKITRLTNESDDLEGKTSVLSREISKLQEENERYRRQLGGRFGAESNAQNEILRKELKNACDEIRELKRQQQVSNTPSVNSDFSDTHQNYHRDLASQSTISQLRSEYEETIEALNDEKRELVMRNSAAITDVQKAEMRAWETEKENAYFKEELTSLKLQLERLEKTSPEDGQLDVGSVGDLGTITESNESAATSHSACFPHNTAQNRGHLDRNKANSSSVPSGPFLESNNELSTVLHLGENPEPSEERPPECTQS